jgi:PAS domain S-box-containing protein
LHTSEQHLSRAAHRRDRNTEIDFRTGAFIWSDENYRIFGVTRGTFSPSVETIGKLIHKEDRQQFVEDIDRARAGLAPAQVEYRTMRPSGEVRVVNRELEPISEDEARPIGLIRAVTDVTEQKKIEQALRESRCTCASVSGQRVPLHLVGGVGIARDFTIQ